MDFISGFVYDKILFEYGMKCLSLIYSKIYSVRMNIDIDNIGNYSILYSIIMCVLKVEIFVIFCKVPGQHMSVLTVPALCSVDIIDRVHGLKLELPLSSPGSSETKVYVQIFP